MEALLTLAARNSLGAAVLAAFAFAASRSLRRRPALAHALWLLVLVKLATPPVWWVPIQFGSTRPMGFLPSSNVRDVDDRLPQAYGEALPAAADPRAARVSPGELAVRLLLVSWMTGSAALLALALVRLRRLARAFSMLEPSLALTDRAERLSRRMRLPRAPRVWLVRAAIPPGVVAALGRPRLLIPQALWDRLDEGQRQALLAHELAHLCRRDHWVRMFELAVTILHWWNPLVWLARRELRSAEELCCDAWVQWAMPAASDDYGATLVECAEFLSTESARSRLPLLASGMGEFRQLHRRLMMIRERKTISSLGWSRLLVCAAALVLPITFTRAQQPPHQPGRTGDAAARASGSAPTTRLAPGAGSRVPKENFATQLNRILPELSFTGMGIGDVFAFLHDVSGIPIVVDWEQLNNAGIDRNTPTTLHVTNERFGKCLSLLLEAPDLRAKLAYFVNGQGITISTSAAIESQAGGFIRSYLIGDLIHAHGGAARALIETITGSVDPTSWAEHGGIRTLRIQGDQLIVDQTPDDQRAVANLLEGMRKLLKNPSDP